MVSLVPSLTEAIASVDAGALVGVTDWCTHPAGLDVQRIRGTKNPDTKAIIALAPDVVIANKEENRELDVRRLREAGVHVWVSVIETVPQAIDAMEELFDDVLRWERPSWLATSRELWCGEPLTARARVAVPIWRDPWMVVGPRTYTGDLLRRLGWTHVYDAGEDRYPAVDLAAIDRPDVDLVLLPDEPYVFTEDDGPEAFAQVPTRLVSGRLLTWYGPAMVEAYDVLSS